MKLALFDFDGTITRKDSFVEFILYAHGKIRSIFGFFVLSPFLFLYYIRMMPNFKAKEIVLNHFFGGWDEAKLKSVGRSFAQKKLPELVKKDALDRITWHKDREHKVVVVSASFDCYLEPWCEQYCLDLISTEIEYKSDIVTGKFLTKNCYGEEKVNRLNKTFDLEKFDYIYAYGDSRGDKEMLQLAHEPKYREFS